MHGRSFFKAMFLHLKCMVVLEMILVGGHTLILMCKRNINKDINRYKQVHAHIYSIINSQFLKH